MTKIAVKQRPAPAAPVAIEILADELVTMSDGIKKLRAGRLNDRALILLIQHAMPVIDRPNTKQIKAVLDAVEDLKRQYLK